MYVGKNGQLINMGKFYFEHVQFEQLKTDIIRILEKVLF
jgi:hypothetical protein